MLTQPALLGLALIMLTPTGTLPAVPALQPNIIRIFADDLICRDTGTIRNLKLTTN